MASSSWRSAPRRLAAWFALVVLIPATAIVWLGIRAIGDDRERLTRERQSRREQAAAQMADGLSRAIDGTARRLRTAPDRFQIAGDQESLLIRWPAGRLEEVTAGFESAQDLEFIKKDLAAASAAYRKLAIVENVSVRASALLRLARVQRQLGAPDAALATLGELASLNGARVASLPADLAARVARCGILFDLRRQALGQEALRLYDDLLRLRWPLEPEVWVHYVNETSKWMGKRVPTIPEPHREIVRNLWKAFASAGDDRQMAGRVLSGGFAILWERIGSEFLAFAASPAFQSREWFGLAAEGVTDGALRTSIVTGDTVVWGDDRVRPPTAADVVRPVGDSGLPWSVVVTDRDPQTTDSDFRARRRLLISGLVLIVAVVGAGAYFVGRAVNRELAVSALESEFVSAVSHEFRTPLTSLRQFTELLTANEEPDADKRRVFHAAQLRATDRLQRLVESLLDFGRIEAGARPYEFKTISVVELVEAVTGEFRRDGLPDGFVLNVTRDGGNHSIHAEQAALARALWNLLDNAAKYSGESRVIDVAVQTRDRWVEITVSDRGVGIPAAEHRQIFDKFVRGSAGLERGIQGTGLGLAMVRHIATAHRGRVELTSAPGRGSTFSLVLPIAARMEHAS